MNNKQKEDAARYLVNQVYVPKINKLIIEHLVRCTDNMRRSAVLTVATNTTCVIEPPVMNYGDATEQLIQDIVKLQNVYNKAIDHGNL